MKKRPKRKDYNKNQKNSKRMNARRKALIRRKRKRKIIIIAMLFILLILLGILGGIIFQKIRASKHNQTNKANESTELSIQQTPTKQEDATEQASTDSSTEDSSVSEIQDAIKDIRKVKNTATEEHHKENGLAICMYHYVYSKDDVPDDLNGNYIEAEALRKELNYLVENEYYFPTWEEVAQYVKGDLLLPEKSVVLSFDDGAKSFLEVGTPIINECEVPVTSFLIGTNDGKNKVKKYTSDYVTFQSHSFNMHRAGGNIGHGGIFTALSHDDAVEDLQKSIKICGHGDAFAYPYGDYTDDCKKAVADAGFVCAVTTENRRAQVGDDPLLLPRVRMCEGQSLESFIALVK